MKGQVTLEYVGSLILFLLVLLAAVSMNMSNMPQFYEQTETSHKYLEAKSISDALLTMENYPGLASRNTESNYLSIDTNTVASPNSEEHWEKINSSMNPKYTYYFNFTEYKIIETPNKFVRGNPPDNSWSEPNDSCYNNARNDVHYNNDKTFLVVACTDEYSRVYNTSNPKKFNSASIVNNVDATNIQNRDNEPGASFIIVEDLGKISEVNVNTLRDIGERVKLNRYAYTDEGDIVKIEVVVW
jgi:hypothetical protein